MLYGHTPIVQPEWINNTLCLDTGCVFGGSLTALRYPEKELVSVPAARVYTEPSRPLALNSVGHFTAAVSGVTKADKPHDPDRLDITDVTGRRIIDTTWLGKVTIQAEQAAGALEVIAVSPPVNHCGASTNASAPS